MQRLLCEEEEHNNSHSEEKRNRRYKGKMRDPERKREPEDEHRQKPWVSGKQLPMQRPLSQLSPLLQKAHSFQHCPHLSRGSPLHVPRGPCSRGPSSDLLSSCWGAAGLASLDWLCELTVPGKQSDL